MAWLFDEDRSAEAVRLLGLLDHDGAVVPSLWHLEIANTLLIAERRRQIDATVSARFLDFLAALPIRTDTSFPSAADAHALATQYALTACDAAYLALAAREAVALATFDRALARAADAAGVALVVPA